MSCSRWTFRALILYVLAASNPSFGQTNLTVAQSPSNPSGGILRKDPRELIHHLHDRGVTFQEFFIYDYSKPLSGDEDPGFGYGRYSFDFSTAIDGKKLFRLPGSDGFIRLKHHINTFGATYDGAAQLYSNIDARSRTVLYEIWFEQRLSDRVRLKAGKIDANTEFAAVQNAGDFLNSSMGYSPTIVSFPTYPEPRLGVGAFLKALRNSTIAVGVFQTADMGTLSIFEPGGSWNISRHELPGRISLGYWRLDGKQIDRYDGCQASGTQGFYSVIEQSAWKPPDSERKLSMFVQLGWAEGRISPFTHHLGGGGVLQSPLRRRGQDAMGTALTWVRFSSYPQAGFDLRSEMIWESYYKASLNKHVALVADFQYLHHPGGLIAHPDCPILTPRLVITF